MYKITDSCAGHFVYNGDEKKDSGILYFIASMSNIGILIYSKRLQIAQQSLSSRAHRI